MLDRLDRITKRAEAHPEEAFNNLFSLLNDELLGDAFRKLKRDKASGVDGVTVDQYEEHLQENLQDLLAMKYRGMAKRLAFRWLNRRSQSKSKTWKEFYAYLERFPLASPRKLTDLIAMARTR